MNQVAAVTTTLGIIALIAIQTIPASADASKGKIVFSRCAICHKSEKGVGNGIGPNLFGIVGRQAGTVSGFDYSRAMKKAGFIWTDAKLTAYVQDPATVVPGNRMTYRGVSNPPDVANLVEYLNTLK